MIVVPEKNNYYVWNFETKFFMNGKMFVFWYLEIFKGGMKKNISLST